MFRLLIYLLVINVLTIDLIIFLLFIRFKNFKLGGNIIDICTRFGKL